MALAGMEVSASGQLNSISGSVLDVPGDCDAVGGEVMR